MRNRNKAGLLTFVGVSLFVLSAHADGTKIPLDQVPSAVKNAVTKKFPKAKMEEAEKEVKDGKTTYEIGIEEDDHDITVSLKDDGTILEIEKEIAVKDLPAAVTAAVKAKYSAGIVKKAEEVTVGAKVTYEVLVTQEGKKPRELALDKSGKVLEDEEAEAERNDKDKD